MSAYASLKPEHQRFVDEYIIDFNGSRAYRVAYPGVKAASARAEASALLTKPNIQAAIRERNEACGARLKAEITKDDIVRDWVRVLTTDRNELVEIRRGCCRHCWGPEFRYQETPAELLARQQKYDAECRRTESAGKNKEDVFWDDTRVLGFDATKAPNAECPECAGEGVENHRQADTRHLSEGAKAIYEGVRLTKYGPEVIIRSKDKASEMLARHLGLLNDKLNLGVQPDNPLAKLLSSLKPQGFTPVAEPEADEGD